MRAAQERISWAFDTFSRLYVSFSAGKDSTVMLHLVMEEAVRRNRKVGILLVDLEGQYKHTIDHALEMFRGYASHVEPFWISLPIHLRNSVSMYEPQWICWQPDRKADWIRDPPSIAITDQSQLPFYRYGMEFEEFVPAFGHWYGRGQLTGCFVGIRSDESLNRWRTVAGHGTKFEGRSWTNSCGQTLYNIYPIYDWKTQDIWVYHGKTGKPHNAIYDLMHKAGLSIHQMRLCQPYGDDQRKGLWLFHLLEPETWARVVARVNGANAGALYAQQSGNILGNIKITKPAGHTWESFARLLLNSLPSSTREQFENKISGFLHWWMKRGYPNGIPDESDAKEEAAKRAPSWRRICKALLRNDYWCKGLSYSQQKSGAYEKYRKIMQQRREQWNVL